MKRELLTYRLALATFALFFLSLLTRLATPSVHVIRTATRSNEYLIRGAEEIEARSPTSEQITRMQEDMQQNPVYWGTWGNSSGGNVSRSQAEARLRQLNHDDAQFLRNDYTQREERRQAARSKLPWAISFVVFLFLLWTSLVILGIIFLWNKPFRIVRADSRDGEGDLGKGSTLPGCGETQTRTSKHKMDGEGTE